MHGRCGTDAASQKMKTDASRSAMFTSSSVMTGCPSPFTSTLRSVISTSEPFCNRWLACKSAKLVIVETPERSIFSFASKASKSVILLMPSPSRKTNVSASVPPLSSSWPLPPSRMSLPPKPCSGRCPPHHAGFHCPGCRSAGHCPRRRRPYRRRFRRSSCRSRQSQTSHRHLAPQANVSSSSVPRIASGMLLRITVLIVLSAVR